MPKNPNAELVWGYLPIQHLPPQKLPSFVGKQAIRLEHLEYGKSARGSDGSALAAIGFRTVLGLCVKLRPFCPGRMLR